MKVGFCSLGCKVNAYETEYAINEFKKRGYEIVSFDDYADVYVVNTCSVTNASDQKSRKMLRSACNKNKNAVVVAMGCYAQVNSKVIEDIDGVSIIIGNKDKNKMNVTRRSCGYLGENFWNEGKTKEIKARALHL